MMKSNTLGLYLHIPFCIRKCNYCDFLSGPCSEKQMDAYCHALCREIALWGKDVKVKNKEVDTIFIGGGTPSLLSVSEISYIIQDIYRYFSVADDVEFSMECNPGTMSKDKLSAYAELGVNRLSIGMQSAVQRELEELGRIHTYGEFVTGYEMARSMGFDNINIDVMSAIPGQTIESYESTLKSVLKLEPQHISSYSLIIEEGTPFYEKYKECPPVDEDTDRAMYEMTEELLSDKGYRRYEISNYSQKGYSCKHNLKYWQRKEYLGLGLGASSFLEEQRFCNVGSHERYQKTVQRGKKPIEEIEPVSRTQAMAEFMYLGLRCMEGILMNEFERCFGVPLMNVYGEVIDRYVSQGYMVRTGDYLALTNQGIDVSNVIFSDFI